MPLLAEKPATTPIRPATQPTFEERLRDAALAVDINSAHIETRPFDLGDIITVPVAEPQTPMTPTTKPVADVLQQARQILISDGWCRNAQRDDQGQRCLYGAVRAAARGNGHAETAALSLLMEAIERQFGGDSIPTFNDQCRDSGPIMRVLGMAADLAETRGI